MRPPPPDPVIEAYKRDIDRTLLRENLKLTVEERFLKLMDLQSFAVQPRGYASNNKYRFSKDRRTNQRVRNGRARMKSRSEHCIAKVFLSQAP
jgi:hypothetical protein